MHKATKITITLTALECNVAWSCSWHCGCNWNWERVWGLAAPWLPRTGYWFCRQATKNFTRQTVAPLSEAQHSPFRLPHSPSTTLSPNIASSAVSVPAWLQPDPLPVAVAAHMCEQSHSLSHMCPAGSLASFVRKSRGFLNTLRAAAERGERAAC